MSVAQEDSAYSDEDYGDGADSQHSQDSHRAAANGNAAAVGGGLARAGSQSISLGRRAKRKGAYTEEERRHRRRLANRESARRMRAKRNEEVKQLETTMNRLQDRNEQLEAQNKEYATCLQQLQQEMCSLRSQLQQGSVASSQHQQQSSSEVHQVLSCGTAMQPHHQVLLQSSGGNHPAAGLCFSGQLSFSGALNGLPLNFAGAAPAADRPVPPSAVAAVAAAGLSVQQQQLGPGGLQVYAADQALHAQQQMWHLQAGPEQQQQLHWQQQAQLSQDAGAFRSQQASAGTHSAAAAASAEPAADALRHAISEPLQRLRSGGLPAQQQQQQQQQAGPQRHSDAGMCAAPSAAAGTSPALLDAGTFPACAEELLNELLLSQVPEQQQTAAAPDAPMQDAAAPGNSTEAAKQEQQPMGAQPSQLLGFRPWGPQVSQQQQQQQQHPAAAATSQLGAEAAHAVKVEAPDAAAMLAARGRAFAMGYANPANLCGFEIPDLQPAVAVPAAGQPGLAAASAPAAAGGAGSRAAADPFATWAQRFVPAAGNNMEGVLQQIGSALQVELPAAAAAAAAAPSAQAGGVAAGGLQFAPKSRSSSRRHSYHSSAPPAPAAAEPEAPAARKPKRRFPLKRPSKLAVQHQAAVAAAAAAAAAGFGDPSTVCQGSCDVDWVRAVTPMQVQLEQQKRRRLRQQLHAAAAPVGEDAARILSASSRVGGGEALAAPTSAVSAGDAATGSASYAAPADAGVLQRTASAAAAASPTSRPRRAAAAAAAEGAVFQRTLSCMDQCQAAFSFPADWTGAKAGPEASAAADGCRSYASEPGFDADAAAAAGAAYNVLDWGEGCSTAVGQWERQLLQLEQQGLVSKCGGAATAGNAQQQQQLQMLAFNETAGNMRVPADGGMPSPQAAAVLRAAAAAAAAAAGDAHAWPVASAETLQGLSPQLMQLQQQLQQCLQRNRHTDTPELPEQQQQGADSARRLAVQVPAECFHSSGDGELDHAVPGSPLAGWFDNAGTHQQEQQQQQLSGDLPVGASFGPAAAAAVRGSLTGGAATCLSDVSRGSAGVTSPKGSPAAVGLARAAAAAAAAAAAGNAVAAAAPAGMTRTAAAATAAQSAPVSAEGLQIGTGGIAPGDLDFLDAPPLDDLLAAMLQQEQQEQQTSSGGRAAQQQQEAGAAVGCGQAGYIGRQEQLGRDLTDAAAGLQGLWLSPEATPGHGLAQGSGSPTGLGFTVCMSQGLVGEPSCSASLVSARLAEVGRPAGQGLAGAMAAGAGVGAAAAGPGVVVGAPGMGPLSGSLYDMAAAAAAAGMPPWSTWHEEQGQWLDDIFASGPTLPHELGETSP